MKRIAEDVFHIPMMLRNGMNAYVIGDVLVDSGGPPFAKQIMGHLRHQKRSVSSHVITHAHGDHAGSSKELSEKLNLPVAIGELDVEACESGQPVVKPNPLSKLFVGVMGKFKGVPVTRPLREGDSVGPGFVVLDTPGHSPGHIALWRESDRILIAGDVWFNMNVFTTIPGLRRPPGLLTPDPERNKDAQRRLAALEPDLVCMGHGPVLTEAAPKLAAWVKKHL